MANDAFHLVLILRLNSKLHHAAQTLPCVFANFRCDLTLLAKETEQRVAKQRLLFICTFI